MLNVSSIPQPRISSCHQSAVYLQLSVPKGYIWSNWRWIFLFVLLCLTKKIFFIQTNEKVGDKLCDRQGFVELRLSMNECSF